MKNDSRSAGMHFRARGRMAVHTIWDHLTRPIAKTIDDVPWSAEAISPEWLTDVLCRGTQGARVTSVEICGGDQGSSVRRNIKATYNEEGKNAGLPENLFCKTTPTVLTRLATGLSAAGEARFYREIRPNLNIEAPICYYSAWDRNSGRSVHLFNDIVATKAARFCRWHTPISRQQAEQIVDTLATFHSRFYDSARFSSDLKWVRSFEDFFRAGERVGLRECHEQAMIRAEAVIPPDVSRRRAEIWPATMRALALHKQAAPALLHSDVHLGNWYIMGDGQMGLCDWQCLGKGHWARDVSYAISTTLAIEDRRAWERDLLQRYLQKMREQCGLAVTFSEAWNLCRQQLFLALMMWTPTLVHTRTTPDMQPEEMSLEMIKRITAAISDLEAFNID
ncbi:MAG TPA: aminoglycoside phosphotransferase family protein [Candidatus Binataceae bacterium]|nr:aminoglycoside phosphotransferase family protein [Candidatus Binataceae bacterium]